MFTTPKSIGWEKVDGIILYDEDAEVRLKQFGLDIPTVSLLGSHDELDIEADDISGVQQAVSHLFDLGHRHIGYLAAPVPGIAFKRWNAFHAAMTEHGLSVNPNQLWTLENRGDMDVRGYLSMGDWIRAGFLDTRISALLVQNDRAAIGAMRAMAEAGINVPRDVSVVGFDGTGECDLCTPQLTTVKVPLYEMGRAGVDILLQRLRGVSVGKSGLLLPVELEVRASTARPRFA